MGCASSAALPFLSNRGTAGTAESPRMNGNPPYELKMVNNKLKENGTTNVKDVNEAYVSDKMKEVVDSTAVQGVIGGVVQTKDEIVEQVKGFGEAVSDKVSSVVDGVEETIETAFGKLSNAVESAEEKVKSEVTSLEENVKSVLGRGEEKVGELKAEEIDELLESLPTEEEVRTTAEEAKTAAEEVLSEAVAEVKEEGGAN